MNSKELSDQIQNIIDRNKKVELDKAWETSGFRKVSIAIVTYIFMFLLFSYLQSRKPFYDALIPTFGFILSNLSLNFLKKYWLKRH